MCGTTLVHAYHTCELLCCSCCCCCCSGHVVLELFARKTMSTLFASFFDHILVSRITKPSSNLYVSKQVRQL
jgi:hypothetical protein